MAIKQQKACRKSRTLDHEEGNYKLYLLWHEQEKVRTKTESGKERKIGGKKCRFN